MRGGDGETGGLRETAFRAEGEACAEAWPAGREFGRAGAAGTEQQDRSLGTGQRLVTRRFGHSEMGGSPGGQGRGERTSVCGDVEMSAGDCPDGSGAGERKPTRRLFGSGQHVDGVCGHGSGGDCPVLRGRKRAKAGP